MLDANVNNACIFYVGYGPTDTAHMAYANDEHLYDGTYTPDKYRSAAPPTIYFESRTDQKFNRCSPNRVESPISHTFYILFRYKIGSSGSLQFIVSVGVSVSVSVSVCLCVSAWIGSSNAIQCNPLRT